MIDKNNFSSLFNTLLNKLIKEQLTKLFEQTFNSDGSLEMACNEKCAIFTSEQPKRYDL